eukprot:5932102-Prymnesium_polylepis.1
MRETARPVPHDDADGVLPAYLLTQYAWRLFFAMFEWTKWTTSGRIGARKTSGIGSDLIASEASPSAE